MVMACTHPGDNWLPNGDVLFMDWILQGVSWDEVLLGLSGSSRTELMGGVDMALDCDLVVGMLVAEMSRLCASFWWVLRPLFRLAGNDWASWPLLILELETLFLELELEILILKTWT